MKRNSYFAFKQFRIDQDRCAMKVCTDSCLLGAYPDVRHAQKILDIGTGTGVLALMLAQRSFAHIDAVELLPSAAHQASENVSRSPWSERIRVICGDIREFSQDSPASYDTIICNPPFYSDSTRSADEELRVAAHTDMLSFSELAEIVSRLLADNGRFFVLLPRIEAEIFEETAKKFRLFAVETLNIRDNFSAPVKRRIMTFSRQESEKTDVKEWCIKGEIQGYAVETYQIFKEYYLFL